MSRITIFCKHYRAMHGNETCNAGVAYSSFQGLSNAQTPCFCRNGVVNAGCSLQQFPTAEELAAEDRMFEERMAHTMKARTAIVEHLGGPWKRGMQGASGRIPCPCCTGGQLRFSRAGVNGHIHAACTSEDCVSWME